MTIDQSNVSTEALVREIAEVEQEIASLGTGPDGEVVTPALLELVAREYAAVRALHRQLHESGGLPEWT